MVLSDTYYSKYSNKIEAVPFASAEDAFFWFVNAQAAKNAGARIVAGQGLVSRPCEPTDILKVLDRLYRQRRLLRDHLLVMRHYGRRQMAPDPRRVKEMRAHHLWVEAMERLEVMLVRKGIVDKPKPLSKSLPSPGHEILQFEGMAAE